MIAPGPGPAPFDLRCDSSARACSELALERPLGGDPLQLKNDLVEVEGLGEVVVGALLERGDRVVDGGVGGDEDDVGPRRLLAHAAEQRQAVHLGEPDVADHDVEDVR